MTPLKIIQALDAIGCRVYFYVCLPEPGRFHCHAGVEGIKGGVLVSLTGCSVTAEGAIEDLWLRITSDEYSGILVSPSGLRYRWKGFMWEEVAT